MGMLELVTIVQQHTFQMLKQPILCHDVNSYGLCICHISQWLSNSQLKSLGLMVPITLEY
jgi:hypothetical protein